MTLIPNPATMHVTTTPETPIISDHGTQAPIDADPLIKSANMPWADVINEGTATLGNKVKRPVKTAPSA